MDDDYAIGRRSRGRLGSEGRESSQNPITPHVDSKAIRPERPGETTHS